MAQQLHAQGTKLVVTVWPALASSTANYTALNNIGGLLTGVTELGGTVYDPFNPAAASLYWQQVASSLVPVGIDGWFLDGPEPEDLADFVNATTYAGPGKAVQNLYPFMHSANFAAGLRSAQPNQRAYIITRCAWAAQQRNGTVVWSGDIATTFAELKTQITAGLNFVASGIPYWTTDIGGYSGGDPADPAYEELYTRWWEYGTFCPIFRSHGSRAGNNSNELWSYGPAVQSTCTAFDTLRYRLMPYIYTLSGRVTQEGYTPMRLLAFDFPGDPAVLDLHDQFLYGPSLLVNPVTTAGATSRPVYLPAGSDWIDFWTGDTVHGGQQITAAAPLTRIPLYVKAGSILPLGPAMQYSSEKPQDPVELRIYRGANGSFTLYEDDGASYGYEQGQFSQIPISWNDSLQSLTLGARQGTFPGLIGARTFHIVWVDSGHGVGINEDATDLTVNYSGGRVTVSPPFETWIKRYFPGVTDPSVVGPNADPDTDTTMNLAEFAIGSSPAQADSLGTLPVQTWSTVDGQTYLSLDVRRPLGRTGISYKAQVSGDLQSWSDAVEQGSATPDGTDFEVIHFRDIVPESQATKRYIRLEIQSN
jgi:alpha-D-xyloside xylohydrolase